jgi:hypothetical protein
MYSRRPFRLLAAGVASAAGLLLVVPGLAAASVTYDPATKAGFVDGIDVRQALGWTDQMLTARAARIAFQHDFWTDDNYSVACGGPAFPVVHHADYGNFQLTDTVVRSPSGYHRKLAGFRITGAHSGISGTTVPPMVGQPCPAGPGSTIEQARLVSSASGWDLTVSFGAVSRQLLSGQSVGARA